MVIMVMDVVMEGDYGGYGYGCAMVVVRYTFSKRMSVMVVATYKIGFRSIGVVIGVVLGLGDMQSSLKILC